MTVFCKRLCSEYDHSKHLRGHNNPFCGYGNRSFSHRTHTSLTTKTNLVAIIIARVSADVTFVATENNVVWLPIRHRCRKSHYLLSQNALSGHGLAQRLRIFGVLSFRCLCHVSFWFRVCLCLVWFFNVLHAACIFEEMSPTSFYDFQCSPHGCLNVFQAFPCCCFCSQVLCSI